MRKDKEYSVFIFIRQTVRYLLMTATLLVVSGCAEKASQVKLPEGIPTTWELSNKGESSVISGRILDLLNDPQITALAEEALNNNPDLAVVSSRLLAQKSLLGVSESRLWPSINIDAAGSRGNAESSYSGDHSSKSLFNTGVGISWELDIWGRIRDERDVDRISLVIQQIEYGAARDSLVARTIQSWVHSISLARSVEISEERVSNLVIIQERIFSRYQDGIGSIDELSTANTRLYSAKADLSELVEANAQSIREVEILLGRYPENKITLDAGYPELRLPSIFNPGEVLVNRPDVQIALERVRAAELQQHAAEKGYLPSLLLTGKLFKENVNLSDLVSGTVLWNMVLAASQPLFDGGRIRSEAEAAEWEHSAVVQELKAVVLTSTGEVKKYWGVEQMLDRKESFLKLAFLEAVKSYEYFEKRYLDGLDSLINMLNAKEEQMSLQTQINELQAARLINRIDLALALGLGEGNEQ